MFDLLINGTRAILVVLWSLSVLVILSLASLPTALLSYVLPLAGIVLLVHLFEYFAMKTKVSAKTKIEMSLIQTMLWGFVYWLPLLKEKH